METIYIFVCILSSFLCTLFLTFSGKSKDSWKWRKDEGKKVGKTSQNLKPIPGFSIAKLLIWFKWYFDERPSLTQSYIGTLGKIIEAKLGGVQVIAINDLELGKQLFKNPIFCGRPTDDEGIPFFAPGTYGIISTFGQQWKEQRRFCHQHLKNFGFGTKHMEVLIQREVDDLIENWLLKERNKFSPNKSFYLPLLSSIWTILVGERAHKDPKLIKLVYAVYEGFKRSYGYPDVIWFGWQMKAETVKKIVKWTPFFPGLKLFQKSAHDFMEYCQNFIQLRKTSLDFESNPTNLVDAYLMEIEKTMDPSSAFFGEKGEMNLVGAMFDFFVGGGDTTANMLAWAMLHLIRNPNIQEKIYLEIESSVGYNRRPCLSDRPSCPFTEAFLWEVLRFNPIASTSLPHIATEDTSIGPYYVRKRSMLVLNTYCIQHDPKIWGDPENFRPERFLSEDGLTVVKSDAVTIFSLGLRRCVGEQVAKDNLFLFVTAICQQFVLKPDPSLEGVLPISDQRSLIHAPEIFEMIAEDRLPSDIM